MLTAFEALLMTSSQEELINNLAMFVLNDKIKERAKEGYTFMDYKTPDNINILLLKSFLEKLGYNVSRIGSSSTLSIFWKK